MKKLLIVAVAVLLNMTAAEAGTPLFDDVSSFQIAKAVKLGDSLDDMRTGGRVAKKAADLALCQSDSDCSETQKCEKKRCVKVCGYAACTGTTPECTAENHKAVCKCTEASCAAGYKCGTDGACVKCEAGEKCGCSGSQVSDGNGGCYCTGASECPAGQQYSSAECACVPYKEGEKGNCPGNSVSDGAGGCMCGASESCSAGQNWNSTLCQCESCKAGDNSGCENPCPTGTLPDGQGQCSIFECAADADCGAGQQCKNPATSSAECIACEKDTPCTCPEGQLANGEGGCTTPACSPTKECPAGYECQNPGLSDATCVPVGAGEQGNCPAGYLANGEGDCVKPECSSNSDCGAGYECKNGGTLDAACVPCDEGAACATCPSGQIATGKGGCKVACTYNSESACKSGTNYCSACAKDGDGCYACSGCQSGYYKDGNGCSACSKLDANCTACSADGCTACKSGYKAVNGKCVSTQCPACSSWDDSANACVAKANCCSSDSDCGDTQQCSNGQCINIVCGVACHVPGEHKCVKQEGCCTADSECAGNEKCSSGKCVPVSCPKCQEAKDHVCTAIAKCCTSDDQCGSLQKCTNNQCVAVSCDTAKGYTVSNHACVPAACPAGYATATYDGHLITASYCQGSNMDYKSDGYSGGIACGKCVSNGSSSKPSTPKVCSSHADCPSGYECTGGGTECRKCRIGSNLGGSGWSSGIGSCNCSVGTWSTGNGSCSSDVCRDGKAKQYNSRTGTWECPY